MVECMFCKVDSDSEGEGSHVGEYISREGYRYHVCNYCKAAISDIARVGTGFINLKRSKINE